MHSFLHLPCPAAACLREGEGAGGGDGDGVGGGLGLGLGGGLGLGLAGGLGLGLGGLGEGRGEGLLGGPVHDNKCNKNNVLQWFLIQLVLRCTTGQQAGVMLPADACMLLYTRSDTAPSWIANFGCR
jgi:hypothetical protein